MLFSGSLSAVTRFLIREKGHIRRFTRPSILGFVGREWLVSLTPVLNGELLDGLAGFAVRTLRLFSDAAVSRDSVVRFLLGAKGPNSQNPAADNQRAKHERDYDDCFHAALSIFVVFFVRRKEFDGQ